MKPPVRKPARQAAKDDQVCVLQEGKGKINQLHLTQRSPWCHRDPHWPGQRHANQRDTAYVPASVAHALYTTDLFESGGSAVQEQHMPSDEEFQMVAQFEAVMRPICDLSFETQTGSRVTAGMQWLDIVR
jgi:hypothetical protein